jgi:hypothetical protein
MKIQIPLLANFFIILLTFSAATSTYAQFAKMEPVLNYCSKVQDLSNGLRKFIADSREIPPSSVHFVASFSTPSRPKEGFAGACEIIANTVVGPVRCIIDNIYSDGHKYLAHGSSIGCY